MKRIACEPCSPDVDRDSSFSSHELESQLKIKTNVTDFHQNLLILRKLYVTDFHHLVHSFAPLTSSLEINFIFQHIHVEYYSLFIS